MRTLMKGKSDCQKGSEKTERVGRREERKELPGRWMDGAQDGGEQRRNADPCQLVDPLEEKKKISDRSKLPQLGRKQVGADRSKGNTFVSLKCIACGLEEKKNKEDRTG